MLDPLLLNDIEFTIYLHTYNVSKVTNARSAENAASVDWTAFKLLQAHEWQIDDARIVDKSLTAGRMNEWLR